MHQRKNKSIGERLSKNSLNWIVIARYFDAIKLKLHLLFNMLMNENVHKSPSTLDCFRFALVATLDYERSSINV